MKGQRPVAWTCWKPVFWDSHFSMIYLTYLGFLHNWPRKKKLRLDRMTVIGIVICHPLRSPKSGYGRRFHLQSRWIQGHHFRRHNLRFVWSLVVIIWEDIYHTPLFPPFRTGLLVIAIVRGVGGLFFGGNCHFFRGNKEFPGQEDSESLDRRWERVILLVG